VNEDSIMHNMSTKYAIAILVTTLIIVGLTGLCRAQATGQESATETLTAFQSTTIEIEREKLEVERIKG
jgi:hypothetical protein